MKEILSNIIEDNKNIVNSEYFVKAWHYKHHLRSNVASHSLIVAYLCYISANLFKLDKDIMVKAALLHDLGIVNNREKWNTKECTYEHPKESLKIAEELTDDVMVLSIISNHMFPLAKHLPKHKYARLFNACDKIGSLVDSFVVLKNIEEISNSEKRMVF